ncbi:hypothetical protein IV203_001292 [Nitzschia inconspicua]|uniref:Uncharacterized protein n=1 Tax=Nitzschia inconspicua TaxID=303405 RepID=A0A9K3PRE6_9STRA|nr:hypothetical protein IV203_001292 [Nitzschia inconspicua]
MSDLPVTNCMQDAAREIMINSFAVLKVNDHLTEKIRAAHNSALGFFDMVDQESTTTTKHDINAKSSKKICCKYHAIVDGNLHGYNEPSPSKRLFRAYCHSNFQPWPEYDDSLRLNSMRLVEELHTLLVDCCRSLIQLHSLSCTLPTPPSRPSKRQRRMDKEQQLVLEIPNNASDSDKSPLHYFFYHNRRPSVANCSEHVDRGVLIVVCLTTVPGLEVWKSYERHHRSGRFVCPEVLVHNARLYQEAEPACSNLVCIMAGDQLAPLLARTVEGTDASRVGEHVEKSLYKNRVANLPRACLHKVRTPLKRSRLSISYELRL